MYQGKASRREIIKHATRATFGGILGISTLNLTGCGGSGNSSQVGPFASKLTQEQLKALATNDSNRKTQMALIAEIEPHLKRNSDGTVAIDLISSRTASVSEEAMRFGENTIEELNARVKAGDLRVDSSLNVSSINTTRANDTNLYWHLWGVTIALSNDNWQAFRAAWVVSGGPGAVSFMARVGLVGSWATGVVSIVVAAWMWTINYVNNFGGKRGVYINVTWATFIWVTPQT